MPEDFGNKTSAFLQWFKVLPGATFSDAIEIVDLRGREAGRGIIATRDIPADTVLFTIPRNTIINSETSTLRDKLPNLFESNGDGDEDQALDSWSALILIMMYEFFLGNQSRWKPYLDVLPESFDTPMFWTEEELSHLQASSTVKKIGKSDAEKMFRTRLLPAIRANADVFGAGSDCGDDELIHLAHRMGSTIMAYAFDLENDEAEGHDEEDGWIEDRDGKSMMGMVPMADILNADAEFNTHVNHGDDELTVTTLRDIKAGDEILNYYGPHPNSELLRRYGYVTERHSRYDVVEVSWDTVLESLVTELGVSQDAIAQVMEEVDEEELEDSFVLERASEEPNSDGTFAGPASVNGMPADLKDQLKGFVKLLQKMDPSLIPDKRKRDSALDSVMNAAFRSVASQYPTTVAEDEVLLKDSDLPRRQRMAIQVRLGEKSLLQEAFAFANGSDAQGEPDEDSSAAKRVKQSL